jgi:N-glycosylase/DNA lyase
MNNLIRELEVLKNSSIRKTVDQRMNEFESKGAQGDETLFQELCFCLMTANFQAEKSIKIQQALNDHFHIMSEEELAMSLKKHGHRFPNMRAKFIYEARQHREGLKEKLHSFKTDTERREWLAKNVKGLGMKESSHFLRNIGFKDCAIIDFHIVDKLAASGAIETPKSKAITPAKYLEIEKVLKELGDKTNLTQAELDLYLWFAETGKVLK